MLERRTIRIGGIVQGVGFRPYVHALAVRHQLGGFVRNQTGEVWIEVEGESESLDRFVTELTRQPPPLARVEQFSCQSSPPLGEVGFRIEASETRPSGLVFISPDIATCDACLAELFDASDRRYRYPFLNCTDCGPRLTIVTGAPYDRERTTMARFTLCPDCHREYNDPADRRFHAQPTACPACGPQLSLLDGEGRPIESADPIAAFAEALRQGHIGAMKGLGGYHLVCDARRGDVVSRLRQRKHRDEKPLAIMVRDAKSAERYCRVDPAERALLVSKRRPIVLLSKLVRSPATHESASLDPHSPEALSEVRADVPPEMPQDIALEVAPSNPWLGVMLPYTPLHHLLMDQLGDVPLVMTSGNRSDEPIAYEDHDALERLRGIADLFLIHDRPIHVRCDDSVTRVVDGDELPVRRSRGDAPQPVRLPWECPEPILATGGQLKVTFALGRKRQAFLSQHMGDLDDWLALAAYRRDIGLYEQLFQVVPRVIAHDMHPDYASTQYAYERCEAAKQPLPDGGAVDERRIRCIPVQHHHAHMASCMVDNDLEGPVIGVVFDGTGYGGDGTAWGGEFLVGDYAEFQRMAHVRYVGLPGGDQAIREPWRVAAAYLLDSRVPVDLLAARVPPRALRTIERMLALAVNCPRTSSAGRLFDAVAAMVGLRERVSYEGQAAVELEWLASSSSATGHYDFDISGPDDSGHADAGRPSSTAYARTNVKSTIVAARFGAAEGARAALPLQVDWRPMFRGVFEDLQRGVQPADIARKFHSTLAHVIQAVCLRIGRRTGLARVVLSGGVFMNALLTGLVVDRLRGEGFTVSRHRQVPPNDGGLSLGQLAVAACRMMLDGDKPR